MKILRILAGAVGGLALLVLVASTMARSADGPLGPLPGGALRTGAFVETDGLDWSFATATREIELQSDGRSRTVWITVVDGQAYIPCSLSFPPFKSWHLQIADDPAAVLRVEGKRYRVNLRRVTDDAAIDRIAEATIAKYPAVPGGEDQPSSSVWFFQVEPRAAEPAA